ncbi:MAG: glycoside hydrolase [Treponema sp.]|nr:glycoside hydrolase [Treponema sp.]
MSEKIILNHFMEKGGFFPLVIKHVDTVFVFCRVGAGHLGKNGQITVLSSADGTVWQRRGTIAKTNSDIRNPSAFIFPNGKMIVSAYKYNVYDENGFSAPAKNNSPHNYDILIFSSDDGGYTWTETSADFSSVIKEIGKPSPHGVMFMFNNRLLMPVYNREGAFLLAANDDGSKWEIFSQIAPNMLEPFVVKTQKNNLVAVMRSLRKGPYAEASMISRFENSKWTEPAPITEPMQHPASLLQLQNGKILLTYGDRNYENQRILIKTSDNDGLSWGSEKQLGESFKNCDFGYPTTAELTPNNLLTVFYVNQMENPYFYYGNEGFYSDTNAKGCYYLWSE